MTCYCPHIIKVVLDPSKGWMIRDRNTQPCRGTTPGALLSVTFVRIGGLRTSHGAGNRLFCRLLLAAFLNLNLFSNSKKWCNRRASTRRIKRARACLRALKRRKVKTPFHKTDVPCMGWPQVVPWLISLKGHNFTSSRRMVLIVGCAPIRYFWSVRLHPLLQSLTSMARYSGWKQKSFSQRLKNWVRYKIFLGAP